MPKKTPPFVYETQKFTRVQYLKDVLGRLGEVGIFFDCLNEHNSKHAGKTGFWSAIRVLMPVIESVAIAMNKKPWELLEDDLDVSAGSLAWQMFRHSLIHGDLLRHASYKTQKVGWGVMLMGQGHIIKKGHIGIDAISLYEKLVSFLEAEIAKNDQTIIDINVGIHYTNPEQYIIDDFNKLK